MADLSVTAGSVIPGTGAQYERATSGATITAGQLLYKDTSDSNKAKLADCDAEASAVLWGVAMNGASSGQKVTIQTAGDFNPGATATIGEVYVVSSTAGGIAPIGDLLTGDYVTILGVATTASNISMAKKTSGVAKP